MVCASLDEIPVMFLPSRDFYVSTELFESVPSLEFIPVDEDVGMWTLNVLVDRKYTHTHINTQKL